nr:MAG TPA: hypothetical protein [Crassvirales sp.]
MASQGRWIAGIPLLIHRCHRTSCEENESHQELRVVTQGIQKIDG